MKRVFSLRRLAVLAAMTFQELAHQKIIPLFAFLFLLFLAAGSLLTAVSFQEKTVLFQEMFSGLFSFFLSLLAIVASAPLLFSSGDRVMILSRALPRSEYFLGKLLGIFLLLLMATGSFGIFFLLLQSAWKIIFIGPIFFIALLGAFLKACLLAAMTLLIATMASSSLFTILAALAFYMIGHMGETTQEFSTRLIPLHGWMQGVTQGIFSFVPDLSLFNVSEHGFRNVMACQSYLFSIMKLGFIYLGIYGLLGCFLFQKREEI